jgi:serine/threonine protein phosphatase PrpC
VERSGDELPEGYFKDRGIAAVCKKGLKPETQNQDDYCIVVQEGVLMLGVFDGHGPSGHQVSAYASTAVPTAVASHPAFKTNPGDCFEPSFEQIQNEMRNRYKEGKKGFDCVMSGTTATLAVVTDEAYFVGHVGDSRAVLSKLDTLNGTRIAVQVTTDHRPSLPAETERIEAMGGEVKLLQNDPFHRVFLQGKDYPGLAMSRAIGDIFAEQAGVTATPDVYISQIQPEDEFLLICSDGVWEFISNSEAVEAVAALGKLQAAEAAEVLAKLAWQRWLQREEAVVDDITVLIVYLH